MNNSGSEAIQNRIQPPDAEHWQATATAFREYLAGCREWLEQYKCVRPVQDIAPRKRDTGLPRDAENHRSTFVYLQSA